MSESFIFIVKTLFLVCLVTFVVSCMCDISQDDNASYYAYGQVREIMLNATVWECTDDRSHTESRWTGKVMQTIIVHKCFVYTRKSK